MTAEYNPNFTNVVPAGQFEVWLARDLGKSVTAQNTPVQQAPLSPTLTVTADPDHITKGAPVTLRWQAENATTVQLNGVGTFGPAGSLTLNPKMSTTYTLVAKGSGGTATGSSTVEVSPAASALTAQRAEQQRLSQPPFRVEQPSQEQQQRQQRQQQQESQRQQPQHSSSNEVQIKLGLQNP